MTKMFALSSLPFNHSAVIAALEGDCPLDERLRDLGFTERSLVTCLFSAVFGDPRAYRIKDTVIALRQRDADHVLCLPAGETI